VIRCAIGWCVGDMDSVLLMSMVDIVVVKMSLIWLMDLYVRLVLLLSRRVLRGNLTLMKYSLFAGCCAF
jgi:hypothetical protein